MSMQWRTLIRGNLVNMPPMAIKLSLGICLTEDRSIVGISAGVASVPDLLSYQIRS
jgi:hypothetical protein